MTGWMALSNCHLTDLRAQMKIFFVQDLCMCSKSQYIRVLRPAHRLQVAINGLSGMNGPQDEFAFSYQY